MFGVHLRDLLTTYGYPVLFLGSLIEGTGVPVPIELLILAAGYLVAAGSMNVIAVWMTVTLANSTGNAIGYLIGRQGGRPLFSWVAQRLGLTAAEVVRAEHWFAQYGGITQAFSRWIGITRTPAIIGAGVTRMPFVSFIVWSIIGDGLWALFWTLIASGFARHIPALRHHRLSLYFLIVFLLIGIGYAIWRRRVKSRANS